MIPIDELLNRIGGILSSQRETSGWDINDPGARATNFPCDRPVKW